MKRKWGLFGWVMLLAACDIHMSENGSLDGYWQLTAVDTLATGGHRDMQDTRIYWGIESTLIEMMDHDFKGSYNDYFFFFRRENGYLTLFNAHRSNRAQGDVLVENAQELSRLGINSLENRFRILKQNNNDMVLEDNILRLSFRKR